LPTDDLMVKLMSAGTKNGFPEELLVVVA